MAAADDFNTAADSGAEEDWFQLDDASYKAVPRPPHSPEDLIAIRGILPLVVSDTEGYRQNKDVVEAAIVILSQSPTARRLAQTAIEKNYSIRVADKIDSGAGGTSENRTDGTTDFLNKHINIRSDGDPVALALTLAHELTHVSQLEKGGVAQVVTPYHPLAAIRNLLAMEGDARAHEFLVALELSYADKNDPAERLLFPKAIDIAEENVAGAGGKIVISHFKPQFPDGEPRGKMMLRIFKAFYASADLRQHYERTVLHAMSVAEGMVPGTYQDATKYTKDIPVAELLQKLDAHDVPYLQGHEKFLGLEDSVGRAVAPETIEVLRAMEKERRKNPAITNEPSWTDAPTYAEAAAQVRAATPQKTNAPKP